MRRVSIVTTTWGGNGDGCVGLLVQCLEGGPAVLWLLRNTAGRKEGHTVRARKERSSPGSVA